MVARFLYLLVCVSVISASPLTNREKLKNLLVDLVARDNTWEGSGRSGNDVNKACENGPEVIVGTSGTITSPGYNKENNYPVDANCEWKLKVPQNKVVKITFLELDIEENGCAYDFVEIVEGAFDGTIGKVCGKSLPEPIVSSRRTVNVFFISDNVEEGLGFKLKWEAVDKSACQSSPCLNGGECVDGGTSYTCQCLPDYTGTRCQTNTACSTAAGSTRTFDTGSVSSPGFSTGRDYPNNKNCKWTINVEPGKALHLHFAVFNIDDCGYDYLKIYDAGAGNALLGDLCGYSIPAAITSSSNKVEIQFHSDDSVRNKGFDLTYTSIAGATSPCQNNPCLNSGVCTETSGGFSCQCPQGFTGDRCETDESTINECSSNPCQNGGACVDGVGSYTCQCQQDYTGTNCQTNAACTGDGTSRGGPDGIINSPGFTTNKYPNDQNCKWLVTVGAGKVVRFKFTTFNINDCGYDFLKIYNIASEDTLLADLCGTDLPGEVTSTSNKVEVKFVSDGSIRKKGFYLTYDAVDAPASACDSAPCEQGGICTSAADGFSCQCTAGFEGNTCQTNINECSSGPCQNNGACEDKVNGYTCACSGGYTGANCQIPPSTPSCGGSITGQESGIISTPGFDENQEYSNNQRCTWTIEVAADKVVEVTFKGIDIEQHSLCNYDYVLLHNGKDTQAPPLGGKVCGTNIPSSQTSSGNSLTVYFFSDNTETRRGFKLEFKAVEDSGNGGGGTAGDGTCGKPEYAIKPVGQTNKIVGGSAANMHSLPWQVRLYSNGFGICGGTVVHPEYVITAAHCTAGESASALSIIAGKHDLSKAESTQQARQVAKLYQHPNYNQGANTNNDISLLKLSSPLTFNKYVKPACIMKTDVSDDQKWECLSSGWGALSEGGSSPDILQQVYLPIVSQALCKGVYGDSSITSTMICAGRKEGGTDTCQGDSGGPLTCRDTTDASSSWGLYGVVSWGQGCAREGVYGVYARVSQFLPWLTQASGGAITINE